MLWFGLSSSVFILGSFYIGLVVTDFEVDAVIFKVLLWRVPVKICHVLVPKDVLAGRACVARRRSLHS